MTTLDDLLSASEPDEPLIQQELAYCRFVAQGMTPKDALEQAYSGYTDRERKKRAPLLLKDARILREIARIQLLSPAERLVERTQALIESGSLRPEKELEAIEFVSVQREKIYKHKAVVKTPADLDEFMQNIIGGSDRAFQ